MPALKQQPNTSQSKEEEEEEEEEEEKEEEEEEEEEEKEEEEEEEMEEKEEEGEEEEEEAQCALCCTGLWQETQGAGCGGLTSDAESVFTLLSGHSPKSVADRLGEEINLG